MRIALVIGTFVIFAFSPTYAQYASIGVYPEPSGITCGVADSGPGIIPVYVVVHSWSGVMATQFSAPIPDCLPGATWISDTPVFPVTLGDSQTGVSIGFGFCFSPSVHVLTINLRFQGLTEGCCRYAFLPHPQNTLGTVEFVDCDDNLFAGSDNSSYVTHNGGYGPPLVLDRYPPDGATGQPLNTTLRWRKYLCSCSLGEHYTDVYFGTNADPPLAAPFHGDGFDPGPLQGETTYYWKLVAVDMDAGAHTTTPVWSFTTQKGVPVEPTTWGRIKKLYGD